MKIHVSACSVTGNTRNVNNCSDIYISGTGTAQNSFFTFNFFLNCFRLIFIW